MVYSIQRDPILKRLPTVIDRVYDIQYYDTDNLYPQRCDEIRNRSFTLKSAIDRITDFIKGQGWEDPNLANLIFNSEGQTGNEILDMVAQDKSPYIGIALHFKYNPFTYKIMEITPLEWIYCRLGLPDERGVVSDIKYSPNWEQDSSKTIDPYLNPESYPVFNPDPAVVKSQIEEHGWDCYPGQILYWTPKPGVYPKSRFDAVFDNAQTQAEIGVFQVSGIQNRFSAQHIFKYPGRFEDDNKKREFEKKLHELQGAENAGRTLVVENPAGESGQETQLIESIQMENTDKMYEFTSKDARNSIRETLAVPAPILGQLPEGGMFNQEQIEDSYNYMNAMTQGDRDQLERIFKKILMYWHQPISFSSFKIKLIQYGVTSSQTATTPGQTSQPGQPGATAQTQPRVVDDRLAKMSAPENGNIERIIRKVKKGKLSKQAGIALLKMSFGFTDEEATAFVS